MISTQLPLRGRRSSSASWKTSGVSGRRLTGSGVSAIYSTISAGGTEIVHCGSSKSALGRSRLLGAGVLANFGGACRCKIPPPPVCRCSEYSAGSTNAINGSKTGSVSPAALLLHLDHNRRTDAATGGSGVTGWVDGTTRNTSNGASAGGTSADIYPSITAATLGDGGCGESD